MSQQITNIPGVEEEALPLAQAFGTGNPDQLLRVEAGVQVIVREIRITNDSDNSQLFKLYHDPWGEARESRNMIARLSNLGAGKMYVDKTHIAVCGRVNGELQVGSLSWNGGTGLTITVYGWVEYPE